MLAVNHIALATATVLGASLWLEQPFWPPLILFVVVGSLLPDIDHSGILFLIRNLVSVSCNADFFEANS
jgi:hypothetical protein